MNVVIQVEKLSKHYRLGNIGGRRLADDLNRWWARIRGKEDPLSKVGSHPLPSTLNPQQASDSLWALRDVSFEVKQGEVLGIIGRNGAGKSTLLKILSRVTAPTSGEVRVKGRIASLLEVGTGFHPELTGCENIFLNGAILGMTKAEIRRKFQEIVSFAEIEQFIDTPVKRYSSGMYVRLAFAVAAHLEPEILIVDEVLAVGDAEFQKKCLGKMKDVSSRGRTVLFVSHNMTAVETLCERGVLVHKGGVAFQGNTRETIKEYLRGFDSAIPSELEVFTDRTGNGHVKLRRVSISSGGRPTAQVRSGAQVEFEFRYSNPLNVKNIQLSFTIYTEHGIPVTSIQSATLGAKLALKPMDGTIQCILPRLSLNEGRFRVAVALLDEGGTSFDHVPAALWFRVAGSSFYPTGKSVDSRYGLVLTDHSWRTVGVSHSK